MLYFLFVEQSSWCCTIYTEISVVTLSREPQDSSILLKEYLFERTIDKFNGFEETIVIFNGFEETIANFQWFLRRPSPLNVFWRSDHCHQWFFDGFSFFYHRFQWFSMVRDHWSNDAMVSMDRYGLVGRNEHFQWKDALKRKKDWVDKWNGLEIRIRTIRCFWRLDKVARIRGWGEGGGLGYLGNTRFYSVDVGCHP